MADERRRNPVQDVAAAAFTGPDRSELHRLVDELPPEQMTAAHKFLRFLIHEAQAHDEEGLSADELTALNRAREQVRKGQTISLDELKKELGEDV